MHRKVTRNCVEVIYAVVKVTHEVICVDSLEGVKFHKPFRLSDIFKNMYQLSNGELSKLFAQISTDKIFIDINNN